MLLSKDEMDREIAQNVLELIKVFAKQGHSGFSAPYCLNLFKTLGSYEALGPLTGEEEEWNDVGGGMFQNNRCSHVFRDAVGKAYDIDGKIFEDKKTGDRWTNGNSRVYIEFPYTPKSEIVLVDED